MKIWKAEKQISEQEFFRDIKNFKSNETIVGFIDGCFDLIHLGHIGFINDAKKMQMFWLLEFMMINRLEK